MKREKFFETPSSQYAPSYVLCHHKLSLKLFAKTPMHPNKFTSLGIEDEIENVIYLCTFPCLEVSASCLSYHLQCSFLLGGFLSSKKNSNCNVCYITYRIVSGKLPDIGTADFGQSFIRVFLPPDIF